MHPLYPSIDSCIKYTLLSAIRSDSDSNATIAASIRSLEATDYIDGINEARKELDHLVNDNAIACDLECDCFYTGTDCGACLPPVIRLAGIDFLKEQDEQTYLRSTIGT